jgi:hypothetical protein
VSVVNESVVFDCMSGLRIHRVRPDSFAGG